jgi:NitT/TauT family transport system permease protein
LHPAALGVHVQRRSAWFTIRAPLSPYRATAMKLAAFLLPLATWCLVSYVPFIWHPMVLVTDAGGSETYEADQRLWRADFEQENSQLLAANQAPMTGVPANPIFLPAPHEVARAFYAAFTTAPPNSKGESPGQWHRVLDVLNPLNLTVPEDPWLHESLALSCKVIFWGFILSAVIGVPLGILCGTFDFTSKLFEPFIDFIRYMPAPAFGALCVAVLGIDTGPKIAIIWIGTFFQMVLVVANTTRQFDIGLLEAAQTLGATRRSLLAKVILPGILPNLYNDMRILIGWAWTYLIVAELIGASSGISYFINQQGKYRHYDNVFAGIIMIGLIGLLFDQLLAYLARFLFPWQPNAGGGLLAWLVRAATYLPRRLLARRPAPAVAAADASCR